MPFRLPSGFRAEPPAPFDDLLVVQGRRHDLAGYESEGLEEPLAVDVAQHHIRSDWPFRLGDPSNLDESTPYPMAPESGLGGHIADDGRRLRLLGVDEPDDLILPLGDAQSTGEKAPPQSSRGVGRFEEPADRLWLEEAGVAVPIGGVSDSPHRNQVVTSGRTDSHVSEPTPRPEVRAGLKP